MNREQSVRFIQRFCEKLKQLNLNEAAKIVEDVAKELLNVEAVTSSSLERLAELLKQEISDYVDLVEVRSEVIKLNVPFISICVAEALSKIGPGGEELLKLRKLLEALINFYKYYSGAEGAEGVTS